MQMMTDVIIIGAGISGLIAAKSLQEAGHTVTILEKEMDVGGRLATWQYHNSFADFGAQFFTARSTIFNQQIDEWRKSNLVYVWGNEWTDGSIKRSPENAHPRYVVKGGMRQLATKLAEKITNLQCGVNISQVEWTGQHWRVTDTHNRVLESRSIILTPPVPLALNLLKDISLSLSDQMELERIYYYPSLCGLFVVDGKTTLPDSGALQNFKGTIYWIVDNLVKGVSSHKRIITMQLDNHYSEKHLDKSDDVILTFLRAELEQFLQTDAVIEAEELKRWRYAVPLSTYPHDILQAEGLPLIFAGDAFGGRGRVEGAYLSGLAASEAAQSILTIESTPNNPISH